MAANTGGRAGHSVRLPAEAGPHGGRPEFGRLTAHFDSTVLVRSFELLLAKPSKFGRGPVAHQRERAEYSIVHATSSGWPDCSWGPSGADSRGG